MQNATKGLRHLANVNRPKQKSPDYMSCELRHISRAWE